MQGEIWMCVTQRGNPRHGPPGRLARCSSLETSGSARLSGESSSCQTTSGAVRHKAHGIVVCHCRAGTLVHIAGSRTIPQKLGRRVVCSDGSQDAGRCPTHGHVVVCSMQYRVTAGAVEREEREKDMGQRWEMLGSMVHATLSTHPHDTLLLLRWPNTSSSSRTIAARCDPHGRR
jgi:hypothetical protein